jgi:carbon monoxide dehydrogenase subunit G
MILDPRSPPLKLMLAIPAALALLLPPAALAEPPAASPGDAIEVKPSGTPGKAAGARTLRVSATIHKVDAKSRIVQIQNEYGGYETMKLGPAVGSLEGFAPGDRVTIEVRQGVALEFQPPGSEFVPPTESESSAAPTGKGTVAAVEGSMRATVTITRIDAKKRIVTFEGPGATSTG